MQLTSCFESRTHTHTQCISGVIINPQKVLMQRQTQARTHPANPTFIKTLDGVVRQRHQKLGGSLRIKSQSSASLPGFLHQMEPAVVFGVTSYF